MSITAPPSITPIPTPPDPDDRATFNIRAYSWTLAQQTFADELTLVAENAFGNATEAQAQAEQAAAQAVLAAEQVTLAADQVALAGGHAADAQAASAAAQVTAGAAKWVSGTEYTFGAVVWSPITGLVYRRMVAGGGTVDPSIDPTNWRLLGTQSGLPVVVISANTAAQAGVHYVLTASLTLTLPGTPAAQDQVQISNRSGTTTCMVARNGAPIMGLAQDLQINKRNAALTLKYINSTEGWTIT